MFLEVVEDGSHASVEVFDVGEGFEGTVFEDGDFEVCFGLISKASVHGVFLCVEEGCEFDGGIFVQDGVVRDADGVSGVGGVGERDLDVLCAFGEEGNVEIDFGDIWGEVDASEDVSRGHDGDAVALKVGFDRGLEGGFEEGVRGDEGFGEFPLIGGEEEISVLRRGVNGELHGVDEVERERGLCRRGECGDVYVHELGDAGLCGGNGGGMSFDVFEGDADVSLSLDDSGCGEPAPGEVVASGEGGDRDGAVVLDGHQHDGFAAQVEGEILNW